MGGISDVLFTLRNLSRADVAAVNRRLFEDIRSSDKHFKMSQPTIDGDSNNVCHVVARKSDTKSLAVGEFYNNWAYCGIRVVPVVDGDVRPTAKQATNERRANREMKRIAGHILVKESNKLRRDLAQGLVPSDKVAETIKELSAKEKDSRSKLAQSEDLMPADLAEALEDVLVNDIGARIPNETGGYVAPVLKAKFQADAVIVGRYLNKETLMALTNDVDIPIQAGDDFMSVKEYTKDGKMTLGSTCKATLERAMECLPDESKKQVKLFEAKCPIFQGVKSRKLRALMMVALGCDVYKQGIKGVGATTLKRAMDKLKDGIDENTRENEDALEICCRKDLPGQERS